MREQAWGNLNHFERVWRRVTGGADRRPPAPWMPPPPPPRPGPGMPPPPPPPGPGMPPPPPPLMPKKNRRCCHQRFGPRPW